MIYIIVSILFAIPMIIIGYKQANRTGRSAVVWAIFCGAVFIVVAGFLAPAIVQPIDQTWIHNNYEIRPWFVGFSSVVVGCVSQMLIHQVWLNKVPGR